MQGYCARCGQKCDGRLLCRQCGSQLADDGSTIPTMPLPVHVADETPDGPSFLRRLALGGITLIGLFQGLKHLTLALALASSGSGELANDGVMGLLIAATLAASVAAGTVNRRAELTGFLLGLAAAAGCIAIDFASGSVPPEDWLIGIPVLLAMVGAVGGLAGRLMVPPAPKLPRFGQFESRLLNKALTPKVALVWWRILFGTLIVVVGTEYADVVRQGLSRILAGNGGSVGSSQLLTWQVSVVFALLGGVASGASTRGGLRQGLLAGLVAGAGVAIFESARQPGASLLMEFWDYQLSLEQKEPVILLAVGGGVLIATAIGGWLGAHLLPPPRRR